MSFSKGQLIFAIVFLLVFVVGMFYAYNKDRKINKHYYKGAYKVFFIIFGVFLFYFILVRVLKWI